MALLPNIFADELDKFGNPDSPIFVAGPADEADAAVKHAAAFSTYMRLLTTVPPVLPPVHDAAQAVMQTALVGQALPAPASAPVINAAYLGYTAAISAALALSGYVTAVPGLAPGPILVPPPPGSGSLAYAAIVHAWVIKITGSVPPAPPAPWA